MPVAEHHDGFQMYDSEISEWTSVKKAMKRDVLGELKKQFRMRVLFFVSLIIVLSMLSLWDMAVSLRVI